MWVTRKNGQRKMIWTVEFNIQNKSETELFSSMTFITYSLSRPLADVAVAAVAAAMAFDRAVYVDTRNQLSGWILVDSVPHTSDEPGHALRRWHGSFFLWMLKMIFGRSAFCMRRVRKPRARANIVTKSDYDQHQHIYSYTRTIWKRVCDHRAWRDS